MRRHLAIVAIFIILICGITAVGYEYRYGTLTYDGRDVNVLDLYKDPENYDVKDANGIADIIVKEDLSKTMAVNNVSAVVYDFRGFDTIGESFILLTAIAGSYIILKSVTDEERKKRRDTVGKEEGHEV